MVTIVNTPNGNGDSGAGFVALIIVIILVVLGALFVWPGYMKDKAPSNGASINVTLPAGSGDNGGANQ